MKYIKSINWIFTYKCNLQCKHCDIWNNSYKKELTLNQIRDIVYSNIIQQSYKRYGDFFDIAISGGEPLLVKDLKQIMLEIDKALPGSIHSISTNGTLNKPLLDLLIFWYKQGKSFRKINFSIDGNQRNHDYQRGVSGSFLQTIKTIHTIKNVFPYQTIEIKLTITKKNYKDIFFISKLAHKLGVFFSFKPVENMGNYTNQSTINEIIFSEKEIKEIEKQIINNPYIKEQNYYISKNFFYKIPNYLRNGLGEQKKFCSVAEDSITIMPDGKIYSCILMNKIGNIGKNGIQKIWEGKNIIGQRERIKKGECPECMLMCGSFKSKSTYEK